MDLTSHFVREARRNRTHQMMQTGLSKREIKQEHLLSSLTLTGRIKGTFPFSFHTLCFLQEPESRNLRKK